MPTPATKGKFSFAPPRRSSAARRTRGKRRLSLRLLGSARAQCSLEKARSKQRVFNVLRDVYGWTHAEVARELGITQTAAKVRLHRARKRLREILEGVNQ